ncbi:MAG TPA: hypothetical protein VN696_08395 [Pyrinomonadaceae bacterium]|nr:hypothetical protein [Pyrinomonadaceae bacterium]
MATGSPIIFNDFQVPLRRKSLRDNKAGLAEACARLFPKHEKVRVRAGPSHQPSYLLTPELIRRWNGKRAVLNITDLCVRTTPITRLIDTTPLSAFSLLPRSRRADIQSLELLTLVISSAKGFSDSHTDDLDGSNHCFAGRKLWLVWDELSGLDGGLEDVERCTVYGRAAFDIDRFLSLPSARWFVISEGHTLFLPANYAHKVVTLEHYLGIGSFLVMLPDYLRTLMYWQRLPPTWSLASRRYQRKCRVETVTRAVTNRVRSLTKAPAAVQRFWGLDHLRRAVSSCSASTRSKMLGDRASTEFVTAVRAASA